MLQADSNWFLLNLGFKNQINSGSQVKDGAREPPQRPRVHVCPRTTLSKGPPKTETALPSLLHLGMWQADTAISPWTVCGCSEGAELRPSDPLSTPEAGSEGILVSQSQTLQANPRQSNHRQAHTVVYRPSPPSSMQMRKRFISPNPPDTVVPDVPPSMWRVYPIRG